MILKLTPPKICKNTGLHQPALFYTRTEFDSVPIQENASQQKLKFCIIYAVINNVSLKCNKKSFFKRASPKTFCHASEFCPLSGWGGEVGLNR